MTQRLEVTALGEWLAAETVHAGPEVALLAGHFAIFSAGSRASDLLADDAAAPAGAVEMLDFTRFTWDTACDHAAAFPERGFRLAVLVDDIQFMRPAIADRSSAERLAAALARDYLAAVPRLPGYHLDALAHRRLATERILLHDAQQWLFSERGLREAAVRRVRREFNAGAAERSGLTSADNGNTLNVALPDHGDYCLVHSGHTGCAGGYGELLATLHERGVRRLIAFVPQRCLGQVALGSDLVRQLYDLRDLAVVNVAVPDTRIGASLIVSRHG